MPEFKVDWNAEQALAIRNTLDLYCNDSKSAEQAYNAIMTIIYDAMKAPKPPKPPGQG